jgi:hypothetical protein
VVVGASPFICNIYIHMHKQQRFKYLSAGALPAARRGADSRCRHGRQSRITHALVAAVRTFYGGRSCSTEG